MESAIPPAISIPYLAITSLFITCLLLSNVVTGRLVQLGSMTLTADLFLFTITYIFGDVLTEVYGFKRARLTIWLGFAANLLMALVFILVVSLPSPSFFEHENAYRTVLGFAPRIVLASLLAYFAGEFSNSVILSRLKLATGGRWLWTRTIGSTFVGQAIDTTVFMVIAFWGLYSPDIFMGMVLAQYGWKVAYEVLATPLTYAVVGYLKKREGVDTYDYGVAYNPFRLT
ncbi:MAG: queuosine precursor transporter [Syntrophomonadaceae bacterium]|nr:queuosine precursor transporter [Syntrophomonadaceae bacterium]